MAMAERFATKEAYIMLHFALVFVEEYLGVFEDFFFLAVKSLSFIYAVLHLNNQQSTHFSKANLTPNSLENLAADKNPNLHKFFFFFVFFYNLLKLKKATSMHPGSHKLNIKLIIVSIFSRVLSDLVKKN
ncbi:hypothetical protein CUMW_057260 [Citrus unshiu]|nr:hypothetical protein CUMW_057260 [Citrus unshiu]